MQQHKTIVLAQDLIQEQSITPDDKNCQNIIATLLSENGFQIEYLEYEGVKNIYATFGRKTKDNKIFCFAGHTDVVAPGYLEAWKFSPFDATIDNNMLFGRGAADMKGNLAACIIAAINFVQEQPNFQGVLAFLITADEEGDAVFGSKAVVEYLKAKDIRFDYCLVGEPSSDKILGDTIKNGRRGSLSGRLTIFGKQGHIAYPHLADNPIHKSLLALNELANFVYDKGNQYFSPTSFQFSNIETKNQTTNVIPNNLYADFNLRFSTENTAEKLQQTIHEILDKYNLQYEIVWKLNGKPFLAKNALLVKSLQETIYQELNVKAQLSTTGGTSDGRFIAEICDEVVEFGCLNATIHKIDECVAIGDLIKLTNIYQKLLTKIFKV